MKLYFIALKNSLNKAFRLIKPPRKGLNDFKVNLQKLLGHIDEKESEENIKGHLADFLKQTYYYPEYLIATKERADLVIHLGKDAKSPAGVLFEVKKPSNRVEMITKDNLNAKAMHELILYFLRERFIHKNISLTHLVITNIYEWFVFDAADFEQAFTENKDLVKHFTEWDGGQKVSSKTDLFYKEIAKPFIEQYDKKLKFIHFDIRDYQKYLKIDDEKKDDKLIPLYKFFTPINLLKLPFINDSNSLDKGFFSELLHIIGLEEIKDGSRKIIRRLPEDKRHPGSLIENTINMLQVDGIFQSMPFPQQYGKTKDEQLFTLALELSITWINRILFLKLLEAQLLRYHGADRRFMFLNTQTIKDFDELHKLFFQVLAQKVENRPEIIQQKYSHIPYLNSSLFEPSDLEKITLRINGLDDNLEIELYTNSILKQQLNNKGVKAKNTLHYFFEFLDAYDFSSVGKEEVQEENKTIINAAVLGLVFEKINGYRDGSIYTPGAITMFLCRETIRKAVVKKFNGTYGWECETIEDVGNHIAGRRNQKDILEFNRVVESIRVADPAVGSGHFLVSSLNEIIRIKAKLGILADSEGSLLPDIDVNIANDELVVTYKKNDDFFEYLVTTEAADTHKIPTEIQRIQETLFNEKRKIIEGSLFGVDINPNSVKICQLRLWIELLKHAYYRKEEKYSVLETLPNIDINIKSGNSLLNRFPLTEDLSEVFKKQKFNVKIYRDTVAAYKETPDKETKEGLRDFIKKIKTEFRESVDKRDPKKQKLYQLKSQLSLVLYDNLNLFGKKRTEEEKEAEASKLTKSIEKLEQEIQDIETSKAYINSFEWRFEFPEVLNDKGEFEGFEVIIGNPPYIQLQKMGADADALQNAGYKTFARTGDIYCLFYEQAARLLKPGYYFGFITSNKWMRANYGEATRKFFIDETNPLLLVDFGGFQVFDAATVDANILVAQKASYDGQIETCQLDKSMGSLEKMSDFIRQSKTLQKDFLPDKGWVILSPIEVSIKKKIEAVGVPLKDWDIQINYGIKTGLNDAFIITGEKRNELIKQDPKSDEIIRPILRGRDIKRYDYDFADLWIINVHNGMKEKSVKPINIEDYPSIKKHLDRFSIELKKRTDKGDTVYNLRNCAYMDDFYKQKIVWGEISDKANFTLDKNNYFVNNKCYLMVGERLEYLTCFLNSRLSEYLFSKIATTTGVGTLQWSKFTMEKLYIPCISEDQYKEFVYLFSELKADRITVDQINLYIYEICGLSVEEIDFIGLS